jgi:hypothetical protein
MNQMQVIPTEIYKSILLELHPFELLKVCETNKYATAICQTEDPFWWDNYISIWYKRNNPLDYGYRSWLGVIDGLNLGNRINLLKLFHRHKSHEKADIHIKITNNDEIYIDDCGDDCDDCGDDYDSNDYDSNEADDICSEHTLYKMKTKAFIDDTIEDLLNRIIRLYTFTPYKDIPIKNIKIICYDFVVIEYDIDNNSAVFYIYHDFENKKYNETKININIKLKDIKYDFNYVIGDKIFSTLYNQSFKNFFSNLTLYSNILIYIDIIPLVN